MKLQVTDFRNQAAFPNLNYRFANVRDEEDSVVLTRDFLGENPLHYYIDRNDLLVASTISAIKEQLERSGRPFSWERVRAVSNNTEVMIDNTAISSEPEQRESGPTLQEYSLPFEVDFSDYREPGRAARDILESSIEKRLSTINDDRLGILLSGGLDSMSVAYLLSKTPRNVTAYTLKVNDDDLDVDRSREIARRFGIPLTEVKVSQQDNVLVVSTPSEVVAELELDSALRDSLRISGNPKKDNAFCAIAMYLIGNAIKTDGLKTVFCGEGPNEMLNDYGYVPNNHGYESGNIDDTRFRLALTFGEKKTNLQSGRGGLGRHAVDRMGKIFSYHGIRLESPYFHRDLAKLMTLTPHLTDYTEVKQHLMASAFFGEGIDDLIWGVTKEKFQDGSGLSRLFAGYDQRRLTDMFNQIYGIRKSY